MPSIMVSQSQQDKKNDSHSKELKEGCEALEAIKTIGKMIVLYYSTKEE